MNIQKYIKKLVKLGAHKVSPERIRKELSFICHLARLDVKGSRFDVLAPQSDWVHYQGSPVKFVDVIFQGLNKKHAYLMPLIISMIPGGEKGDPVESAKAALSNLLTAEIQKGLEYAFLDMNRGLVHAIYTHQTHNINIDTYIERLLSQFLSENKAQDKGGN